MPASPLVTLPPTPPVPDTAVRRVAVGLSGGVDSSVAALLLARRGYQVQGLFMKNWEDDDTDGVCAAAADLDDAQAVCKHLSIPLHTVNFADQYRTRVFAHFLAEHRAGRTPNPDVLCNREIKFRAFLDHALRLGAERIATGHYARLETRDGRVHLFKAADAAKDQSYFLHTLGQEQLARAWFPLGALHKGQVRTLAREAGLAIHAKKDSTGICFIGERDFRGFLRRYLPAQPGEIRGMDGELLGRHEGVMFYTLGQRRGLGVGGHSGAAEGAWYVVDKDLAHNVLVVAQGHDHPRLARPALRTGPLHWIAEQAPLLPLSCTARIRYRQADQACVVESSDDGYVVRFTHPQRAITPGQSVVLYRGEECLGGGVIEAALETV
ncbi:MAG: tRNA 2-thiouridine(34) synthase MnmA [Chromatiales bacterium 21-64-14]|nr:MAG: tRNA 2-thiouridine(34) synthase MnmA [Chromatiales bacterium 21-64-14]HQU16406.1 tRNA 2-thiouridine(34) synthase MnmA [Gammaproteobacteria bacterium]